ncbi:MAG: Galactose-1-phosphate uridylyltransferase [Candidatus Roizmanbacteria bacterium GW2011_GWA2_35_19]|uniref:Galactose-1-phosphate uridylyltransferase n=1 Tax=Candidatus Roizmanbacteria bacterium GW2011_GWA2_35_19 TaxID=1618478 RepID=A0A0G0BPZ0_9BACT|nr:MAG: Galactose-1-phosphate uridylyltransferase [Candidatus Roizmanbacteria bacterium GW2011_GWA2_35_19]
MANYISDFTKSRFMVSNPARTARTGMDGKPFRCPFCPGNEIDTPPETYRVGPGEPNKSGWEIRVVPNKFAITDIHEVIIHSSDHEKNIEDFEIHQVENLIKTYINRFKYWSLDSSSSTSSPPQNDGRRKGKVFIFHNYSLVSGASLIHPHSQVSVVPTDIPTSTLALQPITNIVEQIGDFASYCPDYSEWAYEVWIAENPKSEIRRSKQIQNSNFKDLNENQIEDLATILQSAIRKLKKIHGSNPHYSKKPFGYNFYISVPSHPKGVQSEAIPESWYLRIIPRFMERAGFELSTGIMVNSIDPKSASAELKNI